MVIEFMLHTLSQIFTTLFLKNIQQFYNYCRMCDIMLNQAKEFDFSCEIIWNANLMQQSNFIDVFLAPHVSGTYAHHLEH